ncbi:hypothetical protein [Streptomyces sp. NPDC020489]|uniref:hypothetical protein n=1 Tax=Streptomyces sp. NPDC020489 TaxID=3365077 RepID=UPI0037A27E4A
MDAGDLATWVGSSFAAVAAGATLLTLKSQRDQIDEQRAFIGEQSATLALERAELRALAEDRKWHQARQVSMQSRRISDGGGGSYWLVLVVNGSDAPIRDLHVRFGDAYLPTETHEVREVGVDFLQSRIGETWTHPLYSLGPERAVRFRSQSWQPHVAHNSRPSLKFSDDNGIRWGLDHHGTLAEASEDPQT